MSVEILTEHHLEFLSLKGGCIGSSECTLVKMPHCWKSHVRAHIKFRGCHLNGVQDTTPRMKGMVGIPAWYPLPILMNSFLVLS